MTPADLEAAFIALESLFLESTDRAPYFSSVLLWGFRQGLISRPELDAMRRHYHVTV